jgi:hypothetical protein
MATTAQHTIRREANGTLGGGPYLIWNGGAEYLMPLARTMCPNLTTGRARTKRLSNRQVAPPMSVAWETRYIHAVSEPRRTPHNIVYSSVEQKPRLGFCRRTTISTVSWSDLSGPEPGYVPYSSSMLPRAESGGNGVEFCSVGASLLSRSGVETVDSPYSPYKSTNTLHHLRSVRRLKFDDN